MMRSMFSVRSKRFGVALNAAGIRGFLGFAAPMSWKAFMVSGREYVAPASGTTMRIRSPPGAVPEPVARAGGPEAGDQEHQCSDDGE